MAATKRGSGYSRAPTAYSLLEIVRRPIRCNDRRLALLALARHAVLRADDPVVALVVDVLEQIAVVDLAGPRLGPARRIAGLDVRDFVPAQVDVGNQIPG